jgi:hypothetical protein
LKITSKAKGSLPRISVETNKTIESFLGGPSERTRASELAAELASKLTPVLASIAIVSVAWATGVA